MNQEIRDALKQALARYIKPYIQIVIIIVLLLFFAGISIVILGKNNIVEQDAEKIIEKEITNISVSS